MNMENQNKSNSQSAAMPCSASSESESKYASELQELCDIIMGGENVPTPFHKVKEKLTILTKYRTSKRINFATDSWGGREVTHLEIAWGQKGPLQITITDEKIHVIGPCFDVDKHSVNAMDITPYVFSKQNEKSPSVGATDKAKNMKCPKCKYSRAGTSGCDCPMCGTRLEEPLTKDESPICDWCKTPMHPAQNSVGGIYHYCRTSHNHGVYVSGFETLCEDAKELAVSALNGELNRRLVTWDNLQEIANWCSAADLYDTRVLLLIQSPNSEQIAQVGDTITKHPDGTFSIENSRTEQAELNGLGEMILSEIMKQKMFAVHHPDPDEAHVFVWASNAYEQLECVVAEFLKQNADVEAPPRKTPNQEQG